ncbi:MAG: hypothetical protein F6K41_25315 [Symploca sp. SIO3E6]|nr:hypothetical protein [Caldora sp. SIO3E6]
MNTPQPNFRYATRAVPDVASNSSFDTPYLVYMNGGWYSVGSGTSVGPPLWSGLIARINQALETQVGSIHDVLYDHAELYESSDYDEAKCPRIFRDITEGNNGFYSAREGWDAATGLGRPVGTALLAALNNPDVEQCKS